MAKQTRNRVKRPKFDVVRSMTDGGIALSILALSLPDEDPDKAIFEATKRMMQQCKDIVLRDLSSVTHTDESETEVSETDESEEDVSEETAA